MERDPAQNVALLAAAMFGNTRSFVQEGSQLVSQSLNMMGVLFFPFMIFMWVLQIARSSLVELICRRKGGVEEEASSCKQASRQAGRGLTSKLLEILL
jgi:hypothetical protein